MKANETKLVRLIEGTNQYIVPHFQRSYTWQQKECNTLWDDLKSMYSPEEGTTSAVMDRQHFMGSVVTMPGHSVPEGISKYLLIDGQQRFTTLLLILTAVRDKAHEINEDKLAGQIHDLYLTNRYQEGPDQYKLYPTQGEDPVHNDRDAFLALVDKRDPNRHSRVALAFSYFSRQVNQLEKDQLHAITRVITNRLLLVSIVLEPDDNPFAIFESLNAKGQPLSQSGLIRNFFFMCIHTDRHDRVFREKWQPMEIKIGQENMTEFLRHYLMRDGRVVKQGEVYYTLKLQIDREGPVRAESFLDELVRFSHNTPYY